MLTHSRGLIKEFTTVSESNDEGLAHVTIRATVLRQPLLDKVQPVLESVTNFDGSGLHAEIITEEQQAQDAQALLNAAIESLSEKSIFNFDFDGEPKFNEKRNLIVVPIKAKPNLDLYRILRHEFLLVLDQIAKDKHEFNLLDKKLFSGWDVSKASSKKFEQTKRCDGSNMAKPEASQSKWRLYHTPAKCKENRSYLYALAEVKIYDKTGQLLAIGEDTLENTRYSGLAFPNSDPCIYAPIISRGGSSILKKEMRFEVIIKLDKKRPT